MAFSASMHLAPEPMCAVIGAEVVSVPLTLRFSRGMSDLDLHAAHGVGGITGATAEPDAVAVEPVDAGAAGHRDDVEPRGVVPAPDVAAHHAVLRGIGGRGDAQGSEQVVGH